MSSVIVDLAQQKVSEIESGSASTPQEDNDNSSKDDVGVGIQTSPVTKIGTDTTCAAAESININLLQDSNESGNENQGLFFNDYPEPTKSKQGDETKKMDVSVGVGIGVNTITGTDTDTGSSSTDAPKNEKLESIFDCSLSSGRSSRNNSYYTRNDSSSEIQVQSPHSSFRESTLEDVIVTCEKDSSSKSLRTLVLQVSATPRPLIVQATVRCLLLYLINDPDGEGLGEYSDSEDDQNQTHLRAFLLCYRDFVTPSEILRILTGILEGKGLPVKFKYHIKELENGNLGLFCIEDENENEKEDKDDIIQVTTSSSSTSSVYTILKCLTVDKQNAGKIKGNISRFLRMWMSDESKDIVNLKSELLMEIANLCQQLGCLDDILLDIREEVELRRGEKFDLSFQSNLTYQLIQENGNKERGSDNGTTEVEEVASEPELKFKKSDLSTMSVESLSKNNRRRWNYGASLPWSLSWKSADSRLSVDSDRESTRSLKFPLSIRARSNGGQRRRRRKSSSSLREAYKEKSSRRLKHRPGELNTYREKHVAAQLTAMICEHYYNNITRVDLASEAAMKDSKHVQGMINSFNSYSWWCVTWVLLGSGKKSLKQFNEDVQERVARLIYMMNVAEECRKLRNFHTFFGIMGGLCQPHLSWIWEFAREKDKQRFQSLRRAVSPNNDYRVYKADLSKSKGKSCVPYLGLAMKSLVLLEKEIKPFSEKHPNLVNFGRCVAISNAIDNFLQGGKVPYIRTNFTMQNLFFRSSMNETGTTIKVNPKLQRTLEKKIRSAKTREELELISKTKKEQLQNQVWATLAETGFL